MEKKNRFKNTSVQSVFYIFSIWLLLSFSSLTFASVSAEYLRCEYRIDPMGVDIRNPGLSWIVTSSDRGVSQSAYHILVSSASDLLAQDKGDLWDSGRVQTDQTAAVRYAGRSLQSSQTIFWKVKIWDQDNVASEWSTPAQWTMGLLSPDQWKAQWITAPAFKQKKPDGKYPYQSLWLRREFKIKPGLKRAIAHVCGLGHYEMTFNGRPVTESLLNPGWTQYNKTCQYDTYDVTSLLRNGPNAVGLLLGNGMYNVPGGRYVKFKGSFGPIKAVCHIRLEFSDGSTEIIGTDPNWKIHPGPITFSCVYGGEDYDARLEQPGWDKPDFNEIGWETAIEIDGPGGTLKGLSAAARPITIQKTHAVSNKAISTGQTVSVYDLGQNASYMISLQVRGNPGDIVRIIPAELLKEDGTVDRQSCSLNRPGYWQYILSGKGIENWTSKFFYQGCRYLQVELTPASQDGSLPEVESIQGILVHSSSSPAGEFACSNDLFNQIRTLVRWAQRSNMMSVLTDCPHREKLGWLEQTFLNGPSLRYEFDLNALFGKVMNDMADCQLPNGLIPATAPEYVVFSGDFQDSPEWGSAYILVPWQQYLWTGDASLLERHYEGMKRYLQYLESRADNHIVSHGLGDWYDIGPKAPGYAQLTPIALTATAFYYYDAAVLAKTADLLNKPDEARQFRQKAQQIRQAFNQKFYNPQTGQYADGSQCANAVPLVMEIVEPENRQKILDAIVKDVRDRGNALTAGDIGYQFLLRALAEGGRSDVIYDMNNQSDKPGYGYQLKKGATSLTEAWNARRSSSQNHFMLGHIIEWFYHDLAGISCNPDGPGFKKIIIRPQPVSDLAWVKASYNSIRGPITSEWHRDKNQLTLKVSIPANTSATVWVPSDPGSEVTLKEGALENIPEVLFLKSTQYYRIYAVQSGSYEFHSEFEAQ